MKEYIVSQEEKGKRLDTYIPSVDTGQNNNQYLQ